MSQSEEQKVQFKEVMRNYPTGVTIITATDKEGNPVGLTVNSFASVSLDPLLILWSIDHRASNIDVFKSAGSFSVHVIAANQKDVGYTFAKKGVDRFSTCEWRISEYGLPIISDSYAVLQCKTFKQVEAGDHTILIGEVVEIEKNDKEHLLYYQGSFAAHPERIEL